MGMGEVILMSYDVMGFWWRMRDEDSREIPTCTQSVMIAKAMTERVLLLVLILQMQKSTQAIKASKVLPQIWKP